MTDERFQQIDGAAAESSFEVVGGRVDEEAVLEIPVGLPWAGFVDFIRNRLRQRLPAFHFASTMMADPTKMNMPPTTTGSCSCPFHSSTENRATKRG